LSLRLLCLIMIRPVGWLVLLGRSQAQVAESDPGGGCAAGAPAQAAFFEAPPRPVHAGSPADRKVALFGTLFAARTDVYAVLWENARSGKTGWLPAGRAAGARECHEARRPYPGGHQVGRPGRRLTDGQQTVENIEMPAHNAD
jgi:hypothetical protein